MRTRRAWRLWLPLVVLLLAACPAVCGLRAAHRTVQPPAATPALQRTYSVLRKLAAQTGQQPGGLLLITFANKAFQDLLINWVVHARRAGANAFLVGAMDAGTHRFCSQHGLLSWPMDDEGLLDLIASSANTTELAGLADGNFRGNHTAFRAMGAKKAAFALALLEIGYHVGMLDTDAVILRDLREFYHGAMSNVSDVMVSSDCVAPFADGKPAVNETDANWWRNAAQDITMEQNGNLLDSNFNTGMLFFRANEAARAAVRLWVSTIVSEGKNLGGAHAWDDQQAFGELLRVGPEQRYMLYPRASLVPGGSGRVLWAMNDRVRLGILPLQLFANGHTFFVQRTQLLPGIVAPYVVHNTFQFYSAAGKRARFAGAGLWWNASQSVARPRSLRTRQATQETFLTWDPQPPPSLRAELRGLFWDDGSGSKQPGVASHMRLVAHHLLCLRNALAVAQILGRTLVIPRMPCHCDRYWFPILPMCRSPGSELKRPFSCTLDQLVDVMRWEVDLGLSYRHAAFLEDAGLAASLNWSTVGADEPRVAAAEHGFVQLPRHPTEADVTAVLGPRAATRVLELSSPADAFCAFDSQAANRRFDVLMAKALPATWCCAKSGAIAFDVPPPLERSSRSGAACTPPAPNAYPGVEAAQAAQTACQAEPACYTNCKNRLAKGGRVACRELGIAV